MKQFENLPNIKVALEAFKALERICLLVPMVLSFFITAA